MEEESKELLIKTIMKVVYFLVLFVLLLLIFNKYSVRHIKYDSSSNLIKSVKIEKLDLVKYTWNGIAEYHKNGNNKVDTYIKYEAEIVATMNLKNFSKNIEVDEDKKIITIALPEIKLKPNILFKDGGKSFSFIPNNTDIEVKELLKVCEEDAKKEVLKNTEIKKLALKNAKSSIKKYFLPFIIGDDYEIVWKDGE